jgi:hypothetical protein
VLTTKDGTLIHYEGQPVVFSHRWPYTARSLSGVSSVAICACSMAERQGITMRAL